MSDYLGQAEQGFQGAGGRFSNAYNASLHSKTVDGTTLTPLLAGLERQAQGFAQLARAVADMDRKLNEIKRKLGIP